MIVDIHLLVGWDEPRFFELRIQLQVGGNVVVRIGGVKRWYEIYVHRLQEVQEELNVRN